MEYNITTNDLQNELLAKTLQALSKCYASIGSELYVVGASARDIAIRLLKIDDTPRRTMDLDVALTLKDWNQYESLTQILLQNHFEKAPQLQRFYYLGTNGLNHYEVDIVPFGNVEDNGLIACPPEGSPVMSVHCFSDVMENAVRVNVDGTYSFRLAPLSGQFLIKLDAWTDRHHLTHKDATDIVYIMQHAYIAYALSRQELPPEINIETSTFDITVAGAEWIASDLKQMLSVENRTHYSTLLQLELEQAEESELINDLLDASDSSQYAIFRKSLKRITEILSL